MTNPTQGPQRFTPRVRYEILRRDNHTCRYCGAKAPDVTLQVDHVVPVALGGSSEPSNGVTACVDCNSGKTSTTPNAETVADVGSSEAHFRSMLRDVLNDQASELQGSRQYKTWFDELWSDAGLDPRGKPKDYGQTLRYWKDQGVPWELIEDAFQGACKWHNRQPAGTVTYDRLFRYFASIIWKQLKNAAEKVSAKAEAAADYDWSMPNGATL